MRMLEHNELMSILPVTPKPGEGGFFSQQPVAPEPGKGGSTPCSRKLSEFLILTCFVTFDRMK